MLSMPQGFVSAPRVITSALGAGIGRVGVVFGFLLFAMVFFAVLGIQLVGNAGDYHNRSFSPPLKTCMRLQVFLF
jgi:hypothetical protein